MAEKSLPTKKQLKTKIFEIGQITQRLGGSSDNKLGLRYLLELSEIFAGQIINGLKANTVVISNEDLKALFTVMFRRFTVYEQR